MTDALRFLGRADVVAAGGGDVARAVEDVTAVLALMRAGAAAMAPEAVLPTGPDPRDAAYALPARVGGPYAAVGVKWTIHRHGAAGAGIRSLTLVNDAATGAPRAIVESALLTATRTAAVSALALRHLATAPLRRVALLGAGAQARAHLAMLGLFPALDGIAVWNRTRAHAETMLAGRPAGGPPAWLAGTVDEAVADADAVLACTAAPAPLIDASMVRPGRLILQIGYHEAGFDAIDAADAVVVDLWGAFRLTSAKSLFQMHRAGRFPAERVAADLAAVVLDGWRPPGGAAVYFSSFGLNVFDVALAARVAAEAARLGRGTPLALSNTGDPPCT